MDLTDENVIGMSMAKDPCNNSSFKFEIDEACLAIISDASSELSIWAQSLECDKCDLVPVISLAARANTSLLFHTTFPWVFYFKNENTSFIQCYQQFRFVEHGRYGWNITDNSCSDVYTIEEPLNPYLPLLAVFTFFVALTVVWSLGKCFYYSEWLARVWPSNVPFSELESDLGSPSPVDGGTLVRSELLPLRRQRSRLKSLDTFRGICITLMIFVNYGGGQYWFFKHSPWNGLTVADLVFPWFLWIMGMSVALSMRSQLRSCLSRRRLYARVLSRSLTLIALGVALNSVGGDKRPLGDLRLPGVLQRIGLSYLLVGTVETVLMKPQGSFQYGRWLFLQDLTDSWLQWLLVLSLTAGHTLLTFLLRVPGCPAGYLGPGGRHDHGGAANCTGGAAGYVDTVLLGASHVYQRPTCTEIYGSTVPFDPEGLMGTLTSVLMVFLGVQAGRILLSYHYTLQRVGRWMAWAVLTGLIAGVLCNFSKNDGVIPVNKNLASLSFVLAVASMAFVLMSLLYVLVDVKMWWGGGPVSYAGMNSIVMYIGHEITRNVFPWAWKPIYKTHLEFLAMDVWGAALWVVIAYVLFRKNVFVTL